VESCSQTAVIAFLEQLPAAGLELLLYYCKKAESTVEPHQRWSCYVGGERPFVTEDLGINQLTHTIIM